MVSRNYKSEPLKENPHKVEVKQMYNDESAQIMHITLKPGESLKPHKTPVDVVFYVLDGTPLVHVGEESQVFKKDNLIESPANIVHYINNESNADARIILTKAPSPENKTKLLF